MSEQPRKKRKLLEDAAKSNVNWHKESEIDQLVARNKDAKKHLKAVNEVLLEDEAGGIEQLSEHKIKVTQALIKEHVKSKRVIEKTEPIIIDTNQRRMPMGPYKAVVTRNGSHMLVTGRKGNMKLLDLIANKKEEVTKYIRQRKTYNDLWQDNLNINQTIRDACFLSSHEMTAIATKSAVHIYSDTGHDMHRLNVLRTVTKMTYLPYHFLLSTVDVNGAVAWTDMGASGGAVVAKINRGTKSGANCMSHNPYNAVVAVGQTNGVVQMYTPNDPKAVVEMFCQHGGVRDLQFSLDGRQMVTVGDAGSIKIWDARKTFEPISVYKTRPGWTRHLAISQNDHIAVAGANNVTIWDKQMLKGPSGSATEPYLTHKFDRGNDVNSLCFRPFEDILYCGAERGVNCLIVPGTGIGSIDTTGEFNPYMTKKQRANLTVKQLLEKIPHETIVLNPDILGEINAEAQSSSSGEDSESVTNSEDYESSENSDDDYEHSSSDGSNDQEENQDGSGN